MYNIRFIMLLLLLASLLLSCGKGERAACVAAYEKAAADVLKAESSEDLLEISYALSLELQGVEVKDRKGNVANASILTLKFFIKGFCLYFAKIK